MSEEASSDRTGSTPCADASGIMGRAYGILMLHRRLVREYEHQPPHLRVAGALGDDRGDIAPAVRGNRAVLAHRMTGEQLTLGAVPARLEERELGIAAQAELPDQPAYQEVMAVFASADAPLRARQVCEATDLEIAPNTINNTRLKLNRLVQRGILTETEQGLFTHPRP